MHKMSPQNLLYEKLLLSFFWQEKLIVGHVMEYADYRNDCVQDDFRLESGGVYLEVSVDDKAVVHVLQTQDDFSCIKTHLFLTEHAVLRQVVVQITPWTQRERETHTQTYTVSAWHQNTSV